MDNCSPPVAPACEAEAQAGLQKVHLLTEPDAHLLTQPDAHLTQPDAHLLTEPDARLLTQPDAHLPTEPGALPPVPGRCYLCPVFVSL